MSELPEKIWSISPYVRVAWDYKSKVDWVLPERVIFDHELVYIKDGEGIFTINGVEYPARPGDIFLLKPKVPHSMRTAKGNYLHKPHIHFDFFYRDDSPQVYVNRKAFEEIPPEDHAFFREDITSDPDFYLPDKLTLNNHKVIEQLLIRLINEHSHKEMFYRMYEKALLIEILVHLFRGIRTEENRALLINEKALEEARNYIHENVDRQITLEEIAHAASLSPYYFSRLFTQKYGVPPLKYHRIIRIEKARQLIELYNFNVTEIAEQLGFSSVHLFSRVFKQIVGVSPIVYMSKRTRKD